MCTGKKVEPITGINQRNSREEVDIKGYLEGISLRDCGGWPSNSEICTAARQEGQTGLQGRISSSGKSQLCFLTFQLIETGPPGLTRTLSLTSSHLIVDLNHTYKIPLRQPLH